MQPCGVHLNALEQFREELSTVPQVSVLLQALGVNDAADIECSDQGSSLEQTKVAEMDTEELADIGEAFSSAAATAHVEEPMGQSVEETPRVFTE